MTIESKQVRPRWVEATVPDSAAKLIEQGVSARLARLLARRGVESSTAAREFLEPSLKGLHDPGLMPGLPAAIERLTAARQSGEKVAIVGDYDVDGVSATALLVAVLQAGNLGVRAILPERLKEGYGFQPVHVETARRHGCSLVVTADCGSTAVEAAVRAREAGLDVIVTDHHLGSEGRLPEWVIEINPHLPGSSYPFPALSGAGVAYKLAVALLAAWNRRVDDEALLRITCLGTICDLVPLVGENRIIAARGLASLGKTRSVGLRALMRKASVKPPVSAVDVGYRLGPRINAAGRLASPRPALDLLLTRDRDEAIRLAEDLDSWNRDRQKTEREVTEEAESQFAALDPLPAILVGFSEGWHPGVLGIAAGRIVRAFHRPTVLFSVDGAAAKGSGRSIASVHLFDFLSQWREEYERFGGHSQAVGLTVASAALPTLQRLWQSAAVRLWDADQLTPTYEYELALSASEVDGALLEELATLEPFGMGNRQPLVRVGDLRLEGAPRRFGRGHLAATATDPDGSRVELLGWGWQEREADLQSTFEVLATVDLDRYRREPVLRLRDARPAEG